MPILGNMKRTFMHGADIKPSYGQYGQSQTGGYGGSSNQENAYKSSMGINGGDGGYGCQSYLLIIADTRIGLTTLSS